MFTAPIPSGVQAHLPKPLTQGSESAWRPRRSRAPPPPPEPEPEPRRRCPTVTSAPSSPRLLRYRLYHAVFRTPFSVQFEELFRCRRLWWLVIWWCDLLYWQFSHVNFDFHDGGAVGLSKILFGYVADIVVLGFAFQGNAKDAKQTDLYVMLNKQSARGQNGSSITGTSVHSCQFRIATRFRFSLCLKIF